MSSLPAPPRTVRLRAALSTWWPFGVAAMLLLGATVAVGVQRLARDGFRLPRADWRLDAAPALAKATADVLAVGGAAPGELARVLYQFTPPGGTVVEDRGWLPAGLTAAGRRHAVEFAVGEPAASRLVGGHRALATTWLPDFAGRLLLPALFLVLLWLTRVFRTWVLLRHGTAGPARVVGLRPLPVLPFALAEYELVDDDGARHVARQLVRTGAQPEPQFAIHAEGRPERSRLVRAGDVAAEAGSGRSPG